MAEKTRTNSSTYFPGLNESPPWIFSLMASHTYVLLQVLSSHTGLTPVQTISSITYFIIKVMYQIQEKRGVIYQNTLQIT